MKLLFFDIDGTLAMPGYAPTLATVEAIRSCRVGGNKVFISTGRTKDSVPAYVAEIGFDGGIYSAGGRIEADGQELQRNIMNPALVQQVLTVLEEEQVNCTMECDDCLYDGNVPLQIDMAANTMGSSELQRVLEIRKNLGSRKSLEEYNGEPVYKITFLATSSSQIDRLNQRLTDKVKIVCFENLLGDAPVIAGEISDYRINKGTALQTICDYYHTTPEACIAFGDSMNDSEILKAAGLGIAMANSSDEVKALADTVCGACEEDGVAKALIEMGLASQKNT
jgi:hypothetical protein